MCTELTESDKTMTSQITLSSITADTALFDDAPIWAHQRRAELCKLSRDAKVADGLLDADWAAETTTSEDARIEGLRQARIVAILDRVAREVALPDDCLELEELRNPKAPARFL